MVEYLLNERNIASTGTIMISKLKAPEKNKLSTDKNLCKKGRGAYENIVRADNQMCLTKCYDNRPVLMLSSAPIGEVKVVEIRRYDQKLKEFIMIDQPVVVSNYNRCMGGVDLCDRYISHSRINMRTKKWPVRVYFHFIDLAIVNSYIEYKRDQKTPGTLPKKIMDLLHFKTYIAECLSGGAITGNPDVVNKRREISNSDNDEPSAKIARPVLPTKDCRMSGAEHLPICAVTDKNKYMRCRNKGCKGKTRFMCKKCNVFLCITSECFLEFHTQ